MPFIYVLHFDVPLSHAEHYCGCTSNLRKRLEQHARGAGSTICRELMSHGIPWRLGTLAECSHAEMRRLERRLKDTHNTPRYCGICDENKAAIPETRDYPIDHVPFPVCSADIVDHRILSDVFIRLTTPFDPQREITIKLIEKLWKADKDALGFIPLPALANAADLSHIAIVSNNGDDVGYCCFSLNPSNTRTTIHQCVIRDDARLLKHGQALVDFVSATRPKTHVVAKVRTDLAANHFWNAIGFEKRRTVEHPTSKSQINHYFRHPLIGDHSHENV